MKISQYSVIDKDVKNKIEVKNMHKTYDGEVQDIYDKIRKIDWAQTKLEEIITD